MLFKYSVGNSDQIFESEIDEELSHILSEPYGLRDLERVFEKISLDYCCVHNDSEDFFPFDFKYLIKSIFIW